MSRITRNEFVSTLVSAEATLDVHGPCDGVEGSPSFLGLNKASLSAVAGDDGVISTTCEYQRLFDLIDDLDHNGSRHSIDTVAVGADGGVRTTRSGIAMKSILEQVHADSSKRAVNERRLAAIVEQGPVASAAVPPWMEVVKGELGQKEVRGARHNPRILEYQQSVRGNISSDEVPWCSSFANWALAQAGVKGTGSARALSWMDWGRAIQSPSVGAVAVIDWGHGKGHVGFVVGRTTDGIVLAGGNQGDQVKYSVYRPEQILSYRVPVDYRVSAEARDLPLVDLKSGGPETAASTR